MTHAKPHPEPYLRAAPRSASTPPRASSWRTQCRGARPAQAAGCRVVAVPNVVPMPEGIAHAEASSLTDVSVATLAALVG